jgi:Ca2+-binding EF-hand superfamily protein
VIWVGGTRVSLAQAPINFQQMFLQLDANNDTVIEIDEVPDAGKAAFRRLLKLGDSNKDGRLEAAEMRALGEKVRNAGLMGGAAILERLKTADKDGDGKISRAEWPGQPAGFERLDTNKDGFLTPDELAKLPLGPGQGPLAQYRDRLKAMDKDADGKVTRAEFDGPEQAFLALDVNKDGVLDKDDYPAIFAAGGDATPKPKEEGEPAKAKGGAGPTASQFGPRLKAMDTDSDGKLSREEYQGPPAMFNQLDTDNDGFLTPQEALRLTWLIGPKRFPMVDKDSDGKLSREEYPGPKPAFDRLDTNQDGFLSPEEAAKLPPPAGTQARNNQP